LALAISHVLSVTCLCNQGYAQLLVHLPELAESLLLGQMPLDVANCPGRAEANDGITNGDCEHQTKAPQFPTDRRLKLLFFGDFWHYFLFGTKFCEKEGK
jgi:hypothetical protein